MAETTIGWTITKVSDDLWLPGYTMNPWWGCVEKSPGCAHCYAKSLAKRFGKQVWRENPRMLQSDHYWEQPLFWHLEAAERAIRRKVFCASMADVFEIPPNTDKNEEQNEILNQERARLWRLIAATPWLDWLLLTKRPENIRDLVPPAWLSEWPENVWPGASTENQRMADERAPLLMQLPAPITFLSCEPLLKRLDLRPYLRPDDARRIKWVITGAEWGQGHRIRPMRHEWVRDLRDQCVASAVPFFYKQDVFHARGHAYKIELPGLDGVQWSQMPR